MNAAMQDTAFPVHRLALPATGLRRVLYVALGLFFAGLGVLGAMLPVLPTTPFLLLASWFFVRSSPTLHERLMRLPIFGLLLRDWETHRAVRPRSKWAAYLLISGTISASAFLGALTWPLTTLLCLLGGAGLIVVWRLPIVPSGTTG